MSTKQNNVNETIPEALALMSTDYFGRIRQWASDRNLIKGADSKSQFLKLQSEKGELSAAIVSADKDEIIDGIGDAAVVLTIIAAQNGIELDNSHIHSEMKYFNGIVERFPHFVSEFLTLDAQIGKLGDAIAKGQDVRPYIEGAIDQLNFIAQMYHSQMGVSAAQAFPHALDRAYDDIKDRKGVMYNGVFVKSTDERYEAIMAELSDEKA
jgi:NTP pyrophosphatase (non-canonical NTP hydrolase)|nr:MAG TPA: NTP-PPase-like protein [Caudoviricetes sp.]